MSQWSGQLESRVNNKPGLLKVVLLCKRCCTCISKTCTVYIDKNFIAKIILIPYHLNATISEQLQPDSVGHVECTAKTRQS